MKTPQNIGASMKHMSYRHAVCVHAGDVTALKQIYAVSLSQ